jgi:hypothetical protein
VGYGLHHTDKGFSRALLISVSATQPEKGSARVISYINNQLEGYISTGRPVCGKPRCIIAVKVTTAM